jgi:hypothetical protein
VQQLLALPAAAGPRLRVAEGDAPAALLAAYRGARPAGDRLSAPAYEAALEALKVNLRPCDPRGAWGGGCRGLGNCVGRGDCVVR